ncbi:MAG: hypothetical protein NTZ40_01040 [Cyanobacteria bacterium]|nr:hypothetical protein [Cyanobacteriota bacterium]
MPKPTSKSRQELRSRFVRNAIPTETDFADLIAASLNQADDGVLKLPDQPLGLVRQKPDQPVLRFFADPAAEGSVWQVQLGAGDKPGFGLAAADGKLALFVDGKTGNVGIGTDSLAAKLHIAHANQEPNGGALILGPISQSNLRLGYNQGYSWIQSHGSKPLSINAIGNNVGIGTVNPGNKLTVQGTFNESKDPEGGIAKGGLLALKGNAPQIDFIDTEHGDWSIHVNEGRMYFIREPWEHQDLVLDGKGNIGIGSSVPEAKLNIREITGTLASATKGTLLLDHEDTGGASSIVFRSKVNRGSDHAFIEFRDKNPLINVGEAALLTIGMQNDINDHIALMPSGNVGIGTTTPGCKLDVNGDASIGGSLRMGAGCEIFFPKYGQIRSLDDNHKILFRIDESKMELREYGDIVFSSGSTQGQETSKMVIHGSGNVGIGTTTPGAKLTVSGANNASKDPESGITAGGQLAIKGNAPQIDFIDTDHNDWSIHVNSNKMYFIRQPWEFTDLVLDGGGRVGIGTDNPLAKLHVLGDLLVKGAVVRSIWAGSGNGPTEVGDMGRLHSRTIRINKLFPETALRIVYCDNFRVNGDNVACRWEIRVDGNSVNPPILADRYESSGNRHLHGTVMGYTRGVAAGAHEIQVWIVAHPHNQGRGTDVETGWSASTWSLEAEEVWLPS